MSKRVLPTLTLTLLTSQAIAMNNSDISKLNPYLLDKQQLQDAELINLASMYNPIAMSVNDDNARPLPGGRYLVTTPKENIETENPKQNPHLHYEYKKYTGRTLGEKLPEKLQTQKRIDSNSIILQFYDEKSVESDGENFVYHRKRLEHRK